MGRRFVISVCLIFAAAFADWAKAQGPSPATQPLVLDDKNSTVNRPRAFLDHARFDRMGYFGYPVDQLYVIDAIGARDTALLSQPVGQACGSYDVVANGTFFDVNPTRPVAPIFRAGGMEEHDPNNFALNRGAVAVRKDGTIIVGRTNGLTEENIRDRFGSDVQEFLAGGMQLIESGAAVSLRNIVFSQYFQNKSGSDKLVDWETLVNRGHWPSQCRPANHTLIGIRDGHAYLLVARNKSCAAIQMALQKFGAVVMFDGGTKTYLKDHGMGTGVPALRIGSAVTDVNYSGLGVYLRQTGRAAKSTICPVSPNRCGLAPTLPPTAARAASTSSVVTFNYEAGTCPVGEPAALSISDNASVIGSWTGTWERHDTHDTGGFTLEIGEVANGALEARFLNLVAKHVSRSGNMVEMIFEPASGCQGARLTFTFADGVPQHGAYTVYGDGPTCNRTGEYRFP